MINYLSGEVVSKDLNSVTLDVAGIGYGVAVSLNDYDQLAQGDRVKLFIYEHIREDSYDLYGFLTLASKKLYDQLLSVKNVGPKVALSVLSIGPDNVVRQAIAGGNVRVLQSAKGVGKRAAEQMVVELRDKVGLVSTVDAEGIVSRGSIDLADDAVHGLVALGYNEFDAQSALKGVDKTLSTEERIKQALRSRT